MYVIIYLYNEQEAIVTEHRQLRRHQHHLTAAGGRGRARAEPAASEGPGRGDGSGATSVCLALATVCNAIKKNIQKMATVSPLIGAKQTELTWK